MVSKDSLTDKMKFVHIETSRDAVARLVGSTPVGDLRTVAEGLDLAGISLSERQVARILEDVLGGPAVTGWEEVSDSDGWQLNPLVASAFDSFARRKRTRVFFGQLATVGQRNLLLLSDRRGSRLWSNLDSTHSGELSVALTKLKAFLGRDFSMIPSGALHGRLREVSVPIGITVADYAHSSLPFLAPQTFSAPQGDHAHLSQLEAESIRIIRETVAVAERPGMLFSMGKDSMVMWELAKKAFWPGPPPFPLVVIDTRWKFQDMYRFRDYASNLPETDLRVHINPDAIAGDVNPFDFGSARHTEITKTLALKQVLDDNRFDFVFGGARRDEERSRAKERIFSVRNDRHAWDPKSQRPELWDVYNTALPKGHSIRVFPLSNWTELDVWRYIERENIPVVPLYFSKTRPFVERDGALIMVDDGRFRLRPNETIRFEPIRFRTLGCYPLTGGMRSRATTVSEIIRELENSRVSERSSRVIDFDSGASMEQKKKEGYF